jgi:hypothetical protein
MNLFTIDPRSIPLGEPLNFSIRSEDGVLLARRGHMFFHRTALSTLAAHGDLYVDMQEAQAYYAALKRQPASRDSVVRPNKALCSPHWGRARRPGNAHAVFPITAPLVIDR